MVARIIRQRRRKQRRRLSLDQTALMVAIETEIVGVQIWHEMDEREMVGVMFMLLLLFPLPHLLAINDLAWEKQVCYDNYSQLVMVVGDSGSSGNREERQGS
ncbi:unnamed protein product [Linum trigynum]|uniref:Uncharacterized protein n=1 Tax=Linum trigynum TaxID=586398 RepID=A0AAV2EZ65_9ROSI